MNDLLDAQGRPLALAEPAATAARILRDKFPQVVFTSGRRNVVDQARAMAQNTVSIGIEYLDTYVARNRPPILAMKSWVRAHPTVKSWPSMAAAFSVILEKQPAGEVARISRHLAGLAFDVRPVLVPGGEAILEAMRLLPSTERVLDHEAGGIRWHWQCAPAPVNSKLAVSAPVEAVA